MPDFRPRVLVTITGGVAEAYFDSESADVHVADYDNDPDLEIPPAFAEVLGGNYRDRYRDVLSLTRGLVAVGHDIVARWDRGDLAEAVRRLEQLLTNSAAHGLS